MTEPAPSKEREVEDTRGDLTAPIGQPEDKELRFRCLELALAATSWSFPQRPMNERTASMLLAARRFARFALEGTNPALCWKDQPNQVDG